MRLTTPSSSRSIQGDHYQMKRIYWAIALATFLTLGILLLGPIDIYFSIDDGQRAIKLFVFKY